MKWRVLITVTVGFFMLGMANISGAAEFPQRPVTLVNPSNPGGTNDILGRIWCSVAQKYLGQPAVITTSAGGGGWQGFRAVKRAKPDAYTLLPTSTGQLF